MSTTFIACDILTLPLYERMDKGWKRLVFGTAESINSTMLKAQEAVNARVLGKFHIRDRRLWVGAGGRVGGKAAVIRPFARVREGRVFAEIAVGTLGSGRPLLMARFEQGGAREPFTEGAHAAAVPMLGSPARPGINRSINPVWRFSQLAFREVKPSPHPAEKAQRVGARVFRGKQRAFLLSKSESEPEGAVFQRIGPDRGDVRLVYSFHSDLKLDDRLEFHDTVVAAINQWFPEFLQRNALEALSRQRATA